MSGKASPTTRPTAKHDRQDRPTRPTAKTKRQEKPSAARATMTAVAKREECLAGASERQRSLTANQWKIFAAATIGDMVDFFDFYLIGFVLAFVVKG